MKAAIRLEISKKDETEFIAKVQAAIPFSPLVENADKQQELITYYRNQLRKVFTMGMNANNISTLIEE